MAYTPTVWQNTPATATPLNKANLDKLEGGVQQASADAENALAALNNLTIEYFQDLVANMLRAGTNVSLNYDDPGGLLTISASGGGGSGSVTIAGITDATDIGKLILGASNAAAVRTTIGAQVAGDYPTTSSLPGTIDARISAARGTPNGIGSLDVNGKLLTSQLPELAITRVFTVASQAAMLALNVQTGDIAVRTDTPQNFILASEPATVLGNWTALNGGAGQVSSVNGQTGAVTITKNTLNLGNVDNTADSAKPVSTAQQTAIDAVTPIDYIKADGSAGWPATIPTSWIGSRAGEFRSTRTPGAPPPPAWSRDGDTWTRHPADAQQ